MSIAIRTAPGRHRADDRIAALGAQLTQTEADNRQLIAANEDLVCELTRSIIRGCQAETRAAELEAQVREHAVSVRRIDERHAETVRGLEQQIADLKRRLQVGVLAEAAAAETQPMSVEENRRVCAQPIPVLTLRQAHCIGPVLDPGRIR